MTCEEYVVNRLREKEDQIADMKITIQDLDRQVEDLHSRFEAVTDVICSYMKYSSGLGIHIDMITENYDEKAFNQIVNALEIDLSVYADKRGEADEK